MTIRIDMRQMVLLISSAVDLVGVDDVLHGRRVGIIAVQCARRLGWDQAAQNRIFDAGLLHDIGVSSTSVHRSLVEEVDWRDAQIHCDRGTRLLQSSRQLAHLAPIVLHHHTHWEDLVKKDVEPSVALCANLISLADRIDADAAPYYASNSLLLQVEQICSHIDTFRGTLFAPELIDAFLEAAKTEAFWLILDPNFVQQFVGEMELHTDKQQIGLAELKNLALIVAEIVDAKSHFTFEHSLGVARLARFLAERFGVSGDRLDLVEIAALMHDIGKLQIPDEVLESPQKLAPLQRAVMKKHSFATYRILLRVSGLEELARWASQHHESLNGSGYPFHTAASDLSLEARIIKVADIYQALAQNRPYRSPLPAAEILPMLRRMQADLEVDPRLVDFVAENLEECQRCAVAGP